MGNFTVKPENLEASARRLAEDVSPAYTAAATNLQTNASVDAPGFGVALAWFDAMYRSRLDYITLDLQGAGDVTSDLAAALRDTAAQYAASEDLNVAGFGGPGQASQTFGDSLPGALGNTVPVTLGAGVVGGLLTVAAISAAGGTLASCAALCPAFIPAAITSLLFISNIPSIFEAAGALKAQADELTGTLNIAVSQALSHAADGWEGAGAQGFGENSERLTTHLSELTTFIDAVGEVLTAVGITLSILWGALVVFAAAFLAWLVFMHSASIGPQAAVLQPIIQAVGLAASSAWMTGFMAAAGAASAVSLVLSALNQQLATFLNIPDGGAQGTPDLQEFHVDPNFEAPI
ncbi:hypothetical protein [Nocardioides hwasunensis]|uniref:WXG100 family type VII secretion target n=1 Tax=Nocardioides hwasunensis TaxID=397258 RepID=A0ABR8ML71_9ACTN|nr:hypothetical protein [Nocardioides hwasunensis]MBD3915540.1 hypothetical protein [Nocardioides hwasunensis]